MSDRDYILTVILQGIISFSTNLYVYTKKSLERHLLLWSNAWSYSKTPITDSISFPTSSKPGLRFSKTTHQFQHFLNISIRPGGQEWRKSFTLIPVCCRSSPRVKRMIICSLILFPKAFSKCFNMFLSPSANLLTCITRTGHHLLPRRVYPLGRSVFEIGTENNQQACNMKIKQ